MKKTIALLLVFSVVLNARLNAQSLLGMWRSLVTADIDNDGDVDLIAGNLGLNNKYGVDSLHPLKLFSKNIDNNGSPDPVICCYILAKNGQRKLLPGASLSQLAEQVPSIKKKFLYNVDYSKAEIFGIIDNVKPGKTPELNCSGDCRDLKIINKGGSKKLIIGYTNNGEWKIFKAY
jgi:enediyne biosynthesis protein E4